LLKVLNALQFNRYLKIVTDKPEMGKFARGWLRRIEV